MKSKTPRKLDETDYSILEQVRNNSRISNNELAGKIHLSQPATHARLKKLKAEGIIQKFTVELDLEKLGYELICFFQIRLQSHRENDISEFERSISTMAEILECHYLTGEFDYLLKGAFRNRRHLERFMRDKLSSVTMVAQIITSVSLSQIHVENTLPFNQPEIM